MDWLRSGMARVVTRLPARFQQGKMLYVFFFVAVVIAVLLTYAVISPYSYATVMFSSLAVCLFVLLVLVNRGFSLNWASVGLAIDFALDAFLSDWSPGWRFLAVGRDVVAAHHGGGQPHGLDSIL
jgi:hypothetical protein